MGEEVRVNGLSALMKLNLISNYHTYSYALYLTTLQDQEIQNIGWKYRYFALKYSNLYIFKHNAFIYSPRFTVHH